MNEDYIDRAVEHALREERARVRDLLDSYEFQLDAEARARLQEGLAAGEQAAQLHMVRLLREVL